MLELPVYVMPLTMERSMNAENQQASLCELSWLGGIIDGEGCITIDKKAHNCVHPVITIVNTDPLITDKVSEILAKHGMAVYVRVHPAKGNWKQKIEMVISGYMRVSKFLPLIRPYLVSKAARADLVLELCNNRLAARKAPYSQDDKELCKQVWMLNGRGTSHWQVIQ